jgi:hypothetical protein
MGKLLGRFVTTEIQIYLSKRRFSECELAVTKPGVYLMFSSQFTFA